MATVQNIDLGVPPTTLTADAVDTLEVLSGRASRVVVISNLHATGVIAVAYGLKGAASNPTKTGDFNQIGPYQSMPFEIGGAAHDFKLITGTASVQFMLNVQTYLT